MAKHHDLSEYYYALEGLKEDIISFGMVYSDLYTREVAKAFSLVLDYLMSEQEVITKEIRNNLRK